MSPKNKVILFLLSFVFTVFVVCSVSGAFSLATLSFYNPDVTLKIVLVSLLATWVITVMSYVVFSRLRIHIGDDEPVHLMDILSDDRNYE